MSSKTVEILGTIEHYTDDAIYFNDSDNCVWLPLSQIDIEDFDDGTCVVEVPVWLAIKKELV